MNNDVVKKYLELLQLRAKGMPVQYITGVQEFMSLTFHVNQNVLIPRRDTEVLVEYIIEYLKAKPDLYKYTIMDIGTGSGCIAVSLAHYIPNCKLWAVDISNEALKVARENACLHKVDKSISFIQQNILLGFPEEIEENSLDVIVSNPPYINTSLIATLQREVKDYEPLHALDGGSDGLNFYREIVARAHNYLKPGGLLAFEVGHDQSEQVEEIVKESGNYKNIRFVKDLAGVNRVVSAQKKE